MTRTELIDWLLAAGEGFDKSLLDALPDDVLQQLYDQRTKAPTPVEEPTKLDTWKSFRAGLALLIVVSTIGILGGLTWVGKLPAEALLALAAPLLTLVVQFYFRKSGRSESQTPPPA